MPSSKPVVSIRRPPMTRPDPAQVESFVNNAGVQTSGRSDIQTPKGPGIVKRRSGRVRRRMTIYLPPDLARQLMVYAAEENLEISEIVTQAVEGFFD